MATRNITRLERQSPNKKELPFGTCQRVFRRRPSWLRGNRNAKSALPLLNGDSGKLILFSSRLGIQLFRKRRHRRTRTHEIAVAINAVDSGNSWPKFVFTCPRRRIGRLFARVRTIPFVCYHLLRS